MEKNKGHIIAEDKALEYVNDDRYTKTDWMQGMERNWLNN